MTLKKKLRKGSRIEVLIGFFQGCEGFVVKNDKEICRVQLDWIGPTISFHKDNLSSTE